MGEALGILLHAVARSRKRIGLTNLRLCFPELSEAQRHKLLKVHFRALGRVALQETVSWWGSRDEVCTLTKVEGGEHLPPHLGKPLILLAPHFVGLHIGGIRLSVDHSPMVNIFTPIRNPHFQRLMHDAPNRFGKSELYSRHDGIRPIIRALRQGLPLHYSPDLDFGDKDAIFTPFFGVTAATVTSLSRLAKVTDARIVPCVTRQEANGYVIRIYPAWEDFPTDDVEADTRRMNAFIEERVREMPEQYFWLHKRFKTRPAGEASVYG